MIVEKLEKRTIPAREVEELHYECDKCGKVFYDLDCAKQHDVHEHTYVNSIREYDFVFLKFDSKAAYDSYVERSYEALSHPISGKTFWNGPGWYGLRSTNGSLSKPAYYSNYVVPMSEFVRSINDEIAGRKLDILRLESLLRLTGLTPNE